MRRRFLFSIPVVLFLLSAALPTAHGVTTAERTAAEHTVAEMPDSVRHFVLQVGAALMETTATALERGEKADEVFLIRAAEDALLSCPTTDLPPVYRDYLAARCPVIHHMAEEMASVGKLTPKKAEKIAAKYAPELRELSERYPDAAATFETHGRLTEVFEALLREHRLDRRLGKYLIAHAGELSKMNEHKALAAILRETVRLVRESGL